MESMQKGETSVWEDALEEIGVPLELFKGEGRKSTVVPTETTPVKRSYARPLDEEEQKGVYVLLGLLLGSWVVAGVTAPS